MWGDTATRVLLAVLRQPRPTVRSVATEVGKSSATVHLHLARLRAAGLVEWDAGKRSTLRAMVGPVSGLFDYDWGTAHASGAGDALVTHPGSVSGPIPVSKEGHCA